MLFDHNVCFVHDNHGRIVRAFGVAFTKRSKVVTPWQQRTGVAHCAHIQTVFDPPNELFVEGRAARRNLIQIAARDGIVARVKAISGFFHRKHVDVRRQPIIQSVQEFLRARQQYPQLVAQAQQRLAALRASGGDPAQIARYEALVSKESSTLGSLNVDGTAAETQALKAEQQSGKPGEATVREQQRTDFYDHFYDRIGALKGAVK